MLAYSDVRDYLTAGLADLGYGEPNAPGLPLFNPGPFSLAALQKLTPNSLVFATVGNGAGLILEQTFDQIFVTIRSVGPQRDYDSAETLAYDIDSLLLQISGTQNLGGSRVLYVTRSGGGPQLIDYDSADRYHFQTTYVVPAATGI